MSGVNDIRSNSPQFFTRNGHNVVPSSSLVPRDDPTQASKDGMVAALGHDVAADQVRVEIE